MLRGDKHYYQVLMGRGRGALLDAEAKRRNVRPTALIRDWLYERLEQSVPPGTYQQAEAADEADREAAVVRQFAGRKLDL